ncbi:MAG: FHA domain-containing protein [Hyphomicrobiaceae bacterium]
MAEDDRKAKGGAAGGADKPRNRFLGTLQDALAAASRGEHTLDPVSEEPTGRPARRPESKSEAGVPERPALPAPVEPMAVAQPVPVRSERAPAPVAAPIQPEASQRPRSAAEPQELPVSRSLRSSALGRGGDAQPRTQLIRGKQKLGRTQFHQDPVVAWLVVIGGPGLGAYRPIFEGNNTVGRSSSQRIPIDFGDESISTAEQAYIRYDSSDRKYLFVPNLAKTNVVQINDKKPTAAVELTAMDVITMGRTQLVFVPFCGSEFDWSELTELKE